MNMRTKAGFYGLTPPTSSEAMFKLGIDPPAYVYPVALQNPGDYLEPDIGIPARSSVPAYKVTQPTPQGSVGNPQTCPK
jgi:hypothetical protein